MHRTDEIKFQVLENSTIIHGIKEQIGYIMFRLNNYLNRLEELEANASKDRKTPDRIEIMSYQDTCQISTLKHIIGRIRIIVNSIESPASAANAIQSIRQILIEEIY